MVFNTELDLANRNTKDIGVMKNREEYSKIALRLCYPYDCIKSDLVKNDSYCDQYTEAL